MPVAPLVARSVGPKDPVGRPRDDVLLAAWNVLTARGTRIDLLGGTWNGDEVVLAPWTDFPACAEVALGPVLIELLVRLTIGPLSGASLRGHGSSLRKVAARADRAHQPTCWGKGAGAAPEGGVGAAPDIH